MSTNHRQAVVLVSLLVSRLLVGAAETSLSELNQPVGVVSELLLKPAAMPKKGVLDGLAAGLLPNTSKDCTRAFQAALEITRRQRGTSLKLQSGDYHFWPRRAAKRDHYQSTPPRSFPSPTRYCWTARKAPS